MKQIDQEKVDKIFKLSKRGLNNSAIARNVGCCRRTVIRTLDNCVPSDNSERRPRGKEHLAVLADANIMPLHELEQEMKIEPAGNTTKVFFERLRRLRGLDKLSQVELEQYALGLFKRLYDEGFNYVCRSCGCVSIGTERHCPSPIEPLDDLWAANKLVLCHV